MLYQYEGRDIKISIGARFDGENLVVEGYDIGERVEQYWGDSDYEYSLTVPGEGVIQLSEIFGIPLGDKQIFLNALQARFHSNTTYSDFVKFLEDHRIRYEGFSWI